MKDTGLIHRLAFSAKYALRGKASAGDDEEGMLKYLVGALAVIASMVCVTILCTEGKISGEVAIAFFAMVIGYLFGVHVQLR